MRFAQDLEPVANTQHFTTFACKFDHALHDRAETGNCSCTEVIAVRKSPGQNNAVISSELRQVTILMPKHYTFLFKIMNQRIMDIAVAVGAGENNNTKFHGDKITQKLADGRELVNSLFPQKGTVLQVKYIAKCNKKQEQCKPALPIKIGTGMKC